MVLRSRHVSYLSRLIIYNTKQTKTMMIVLTTETQKSVPNNPASPENKSETQEAPIIAAIITTMIIIMQPISILFHSFEATARYLQYGFLIPHLLLVSQASKQFENLVLPPKFASIVSSSTHDYGMLWHDQD